MDVTLRQRGRASIDFAISTGAASAPVYGQVQQDVKKAGLTEETLADDLDRRWEQIEDVLEHSRPYRISSLVMDWGGVTGGKLCIDAFDEIRNDIEPQLKDLQKAGPATLDPNPDLEVPPYFNRYWVHRSTGGWEGHDYMGFIHSELIHRRMVNASYGGNIFGARRDVMDELPRQDYKKVLEMGAGSGHSTAAIQDAFPDAEIHGIDLSLRMLEQAQRRANENGWAWKLKRGNFENTGYDDNSFDLVSSFIVLHEIPVRTLKNMFQEAFRVLKPGGDMIMTDAMRYSALNKLEEWRADLLAQRGGEPFWRATATLDLKQVAEDAGFVDVVSERFKDSIYWLVRGRKPE